MTMHEYVLDQLQKWKFRWPEVARETGISQRTIEKIARREVRDPGVSRVQTLHDFFRKVEAA